MSNPFVRHHGYYSEVGDVVTVSDNITYLDVIGVMDSLNSFFPEDCDDLYSELLDKADSIECSVTNAFEVLHNRMEEDREESVHRYDDDDEDEDENDDNDDDDEDDEDENDDNEDDEENEDDSDEEDDEDEDYWFDGDDAIWDTLRMTVNEVTDRFKVAVQDKLKFVDFYANKLIISEKLTEEELRLIRTFINNFVRNFHETDEYDEIASEFSYKNIQWADKDEIKDFLDKYISTLNVLAFFELQVDDTVKIAFSKCNFVDVVKEYLSNSDLINFVLYYDIGHYNEEFESADFTLSDDMKKLYVHLKEVNDNL